MGVRSQGRRSRWGVNVLVACAFLAAGCATADETASTRGSLATVPATTPTSSASDNPASAATVAPSPSTAIMTTATPIPPPYSARYAGMRYVHVTNATEEGLPNGIVQHEGWPVIDQDLNMVPAHEWWPKAPRYWGARVTDQRRRMIWFERFVRAPDPDRHEVEIVDTRDLPRSRDNEQLLSDSCKLNGRRDPELMALARFSGGTFSTEIQSAWRLNRKTARIDDLATRGIVCESKADRL